MRKLGVIAGLIFVARAGGIRAQGEAPAVEPSVARRRIGRPGAGVVAPAPESVAAPASPSDEPVHRLELGAWSSRWHAVESAAARRLCFRRRMPPSPTESLSFTVRIVSGLSVGVAPQAVFNVKGQGDSENGATEYDFMARIAYAHAVLPRLTLYGEILPGYSAISLPSHRLNIEGATVSNPKGLVLGFGAGAAMDLAEMFFVDLGLGYQLGYQHGSVGGTDFDFKTNFLRIALGGGVGSSWIGRQRIVRLNAGGDGGDDPGGSRRRPAAGSVASVGLQPRFVTAWGSGRAVNPGEFMVRERTTVLGLFLIAAAGCGSSRDASRRYQPDGGTAGSHFGGDGAPNDAADAAPTGGAADASGGAPAIGGMPGSGGSVGLGGGAGGVAGSGSGRGGGSGGTSGGGGGERRVAGRGGTSDASGGGGGSDPGGAGGQALLLPSSCEARTQIATDDNCTLYAYCDSIPYITTCRRLDSVVGDVAPRLATRSGPTRSKGRLESKRARWRPGSAPKTR